MRRLPALAFGALVLATVAAFFITQHLKVSDPLIAGYRVIPGSFNPVNGRVCKLKAGPTSFRRTDISFYLPDHTDNTGVFIVNSGGEVIRTIGWRRMQITKRVNFLWNGRADNGSVVPDGTYYAKIALQQEGRAFVVSDHPIHVRTTPPQPRVKVTQKGNSWSVHFTPHGYKEAELVVYRSQPNGSLHEVTTVPVSDKHGASSWNGTIDGSPAPAGTYMIGVRMTDAACNLGSYPASKRVQAATTAHTGVTISYLSAEPQLDPVPAGTDTSLAVNSRGSAYTWALRVPGARRSLEHGSEPNDRSPLKIRLPGSAAGLYLVTVRSGSHSATVPVVASASRDAPVLVVLPALSWQGANPWDDDGSGVPETLSGGDRIELDRPLVTGPPAGLADQQALLAYLKSNHLHYQLTTDVALALGTGPALAGHRGVILDGPFSWLPSGVAGALREYAKDGGHVLSLGLDSLQAVAPVRPPAPRSSGGPTAGPARTLRVDPFGARHGQVQTGPDGRPFQTITPPAGSSTVPLTAATATAPATESGMTAYTFGRGAVVEVGGAGLVDGLRLHQIAYRQTFDSVWKLLTG